MIISRDWGLLGWLLLVTIRIIPENSLRKTHQFRPARSERSGLRGSTHEMSHATWLLSLEVRWWRGLIPLALSSFSPPWLLGSGGACGMWHRMDSNYAGCPGVHFACRHSIPSEHQIKHTLWNLLDTLWEICLRSHLWSQWLEEISTWREPSWSRCQHFRGETQSEIVHHCPGDRKWQVNHNVSVANSKATMVGHGLCMFMPPGQKPYV